MFCDRTFHLLELDDYRFKGGANRNSRWNREAPALSTALAPLSSRPLSGTARLRRGSRHGTSSGAEQAPREFGHLRVAALDPAKLARLIDQELQQAAETVATLKADDQPAM
jgi:hypothetical protein